MRVDVVVDDFPERGLHGLVVVVVEGLRLGRTVTPAEMDDFFQSSRIFFASLSKFKIEFYLIVFAVWSRVEFLTSNLNETMVAAILMALGSLDFLDVDFDPGGLLRLSKSTFKSQNSDIVVVINPRNVTNCSVRSVSISRIGAQFVNALFTLSGNKHAQRT